MRNSVLTLAIPVILAACLAACGGGGGSSSTAGSNAITDSIAPTVNYTTPEEHASGFTTNSSVTVTFDQQMDPATINQQTFTISGIAGAVSYEPESRTATFSHQGLNRNSIYTATITRGVKDLAGNAMANEYSWTFTTSSSADAVPPSVIRWVPSSTNVPVNSAVTAIFSEPMDVLSIIGAFTFREEASSAPVPCTIEYIGGTATFKPTGDLKANTSYTASIATGASDLAGNRLVPVNSSWTFTTGMTRDDTAPLIAPGSETPANGSTDVSDTSPLSIAFDEPIYPFLFGTVNGVPGTISFDYAANRVTLIPSQKLVRGSRYSASVRAKDMAGNRMTERYTWSFTVPALP